MKRGAVSDILWVSWRVMRRGNECILAEEESEDEKKAEKIVNLMQKKRPDSMDTLEMVRLLQMMKASVTRESDQ